MLLIPVCVSLRHSPLTMFFADSYAGLMFIVFSFKQIAENDDCDLTVFKKCEDLVLSVSTHARIELMSVAYEFL